MRLSRPWLAGLATAVVAPCLSAAQISIVTNDPPNEGFNDPTPFTAEGGNHATTLGEARLNVVRAAAEQWGALLDSPVEIILEAGFEPLPDDQCDSDSGTLAAAGPATFFAAFDNAPDDNTFYPVALANALAGRDLAEDLPDIFADFNGAVDSDPNCLSNARFYYGFDHAGANNTIDFYNVVMHELGHGFGVTNGIDESGEAPREGFFIVYDRLLFDNSQNRLWTDMTVAQRQDSAVNTGNVVITGSQSAAGAADRGLRNGNGTDTNGRPLIYAPNPYEEGSSIAHWDTEAEPSLLMEPFAARSVRVNRGVDLTACLLADIGWQLLINNCHDDHLPDTPPEIGAIGDQTTTTSTPTGPVSFTVTDNNRTSAAGTLTLTGRSDNQSVVPDDQITFSGSDGTRSVNVTPTTRNSRAVITVVLSDGRYTAREQFEVVVRSTTGNLPPKARDDRITLLSTETATGSLLGDNGAGADSDPEGDTLQISAIDGSAGNVGTAFTTPAGSQLTVNADGSFSCTPGGDLASLPPGQEASETLEYTLEDSNGGADQAQVTFVITGDPGEDLHANTPSGATTLVIDNTRTLVDGIINVSGDLDYFRFTLSQTSDVVLTTTGETDTYATLITDDGAFVAENDDIVLGQQRNFLIEITLAAGTYVLEVRGFDESVTGAYQLDASATPSDNTPAQPTDQGGGGGGSGAWTLALLPLIFGVRRRRR